MATGDKRGVMPRSRALLLERFDLLHHRGSSHGESRIIRDLALLWEGAFRVPDGWLTAVSEHGGSMLSATKEVVMFQVLAVKKGAAVRDNAEVVSIEKGLEGGVVVKTSSDEDAEEFHGANCVITVGAWASKLLRSVAGVELPIQPLQPVSSAAAAMATGDQRGVQPRSLCASHIQRLRVAVGSNAQCLVVEVVDDPPAHDTHLGDSSSHRHGHQRPARRDAEVCARLLFSRACAWPLAPTHLVGLGLTCRSSWAEKAAAAEGSCACARSMAVGSNARRLVGLGLPLLGPCSFLNQLGPCSCLIKLPLFKH
ncbi:putative sarcosine oxidase [Panicum miliaceum]|uniref:Sarcosine oxidase n=1 Tax=Panicum miliaceum TaxID=4540 RepID=A0A3L6SM28_PANMI|nr:putative sarcosine oxidase [Panicum miliaceum]